MLDDFIARRVYTPFYKGRFNSVGQRLLIKGRVTIKGHVDAGDVLLMEKGTVLAGNIKIGNHVYLNSPTLIANEGISIGDYCLIGPETTILDSDLHDSMETQPKPNVSP